MDFMYWDSCLVFNPKDPRLKISSHMTLLCCLIWIWADALSLDRSLIKTCCFAVSKFAQVSIQNMWFSSYVIFFTQRPMIDTKIEQSYGRCFGQQQLLANSIEIFISHEKKWLVAAQNLQSIETLLILELSKYSKSLAGSCQQRLLTTRKRPVFILAHPTGASRAGKLPKELGS